MKIIFLTLVFLFCILVFLSLNLYINFQKVTKKYIKK